MKKIILALIAVCFYFSISYSQWVQSSNGINGGTVNSILSSGGNIFAGTLTGVYKSTDNGNIWYQTSMSDKFVYSLAVNNGTLFAGSFGVYYSTDNGLNWTKLPFQNPMSVYYAVEFLNGTGKGIAIGNRIAPLPGFSDLLISRTTNYGTNWTDYLIPDTINTLYGSSMVDANNWFICGGGFSSGIIYKTTNGGEPIGIKPISNEVPNQFSLSQNYPNPFNPNTRIKFDISPNVKSETSNAPLSFGEGSGVRLVIYDILGREIAVLVNEQLRAGSYEVDFDGSNYLSGVYFYKLTAVDASAPLSINYSETKKMVLLK
jgi:hypothetical protein